MKVPGDRVPGPHGHLLSGPWAPSPLPCGRGDRAGSGTEAPAQVHEEAGRAGRLTRARAQRLALRLYNSEPRGEFESTPSCSTEVARPTSSSELCKTPPRVLRSHETTARRREPERRHAVTENPEEPRPEPLPSGPASLGQAGWEGLQEERHRVQPAGPLGAQRGQRRVPHLDGTVSGRGDDRASPGDFTEPSAPEAAVTAA